MPTVIQVAVLACKSVIAVLLLAAGGAKLADLPGFASTVRLFWPVPRRGSLLLAAGIAAGELAAGAVSLSVPQVGWPNAVVLVICVAFLVTWTVGYVRHRGRSCRCFGALSARGFDRTGIVRSAVLVLAALAALAPVPTRAVQLGLGGQLALLAGGALIACAAFSAAAAVGRSRVLRQA
ncbi:MAG TPA: MauE/DoxX family redox-associated membrane protein [Streptosporangiaceae bacterium]|nr:MauE/DoxX family redox-associated membrane protein [Streptosporangiaceae bacterium]